MTGSCHLSVIVCTRNHASSLERTLESLIASRHDESLTWELMVVDNNSADATPRAVAQCASHSNIPVRYVVEPRQGLSRARNRGMANAHGRILAFTDDDVRVHATWIAEICHEFGRDPRLAMVCGRTLPMYEDTFPMGVKTSEVREVFRHPAPPLGVGIGNNMSIRADVARRIGAFDESLGAGAICGAAEDTDYIYRVLKAGHPVLYSPAPLAYHDHDRVSAEQIARIQRNYRRGFGAFVVKHSIRGDSWALRAGWWDQAAMWRSLLTEPDSRMTCLRQLRATWAGYALGLALAIGG